MRRCRGDFGGQPMGGSNRADGAEGRTEKVDAIDSSPDRSGRRSVGEDSGFEAGATGSSDRHSQGRSDEDRRASPADVASRWLADAGGVSAFAGQQQHFDGVGTTQHDFGTSAVERAEASPAIESIPTIAARANQGSRRWWKTPFMPVPGSDVPNVSPSPRIIGGRGIKTSWILPRVGSGRRAGRARPAPRRPQFDLPRPLLPPQRRLPIDIGTSTRPPNDPKSTEPAVEAYSGGSVAIASA